MTIKRQSFIYKYCNIYSFLIFSYYFIILKTFFFKFLLSVPLLFIAAKIRKPKKVLITNFLKDVVSCRHVVTKKLEFLFYFWKTRVFQKTRVFRMGWKYKNLSFSNSTFSDEKTRVLKTRVFFSYGVGLIEKKKKKCSSLWTYFI